MDSSQNSKKERISSKPEQKTWSAESLPLADKMPMEEDLDLALISSEALLEELYKRVDGMILITYEHTTDETASDGIFVMKGSQTVVRGLRDMVMEGVRRATRPSD